MESRFSLRELATGALATLGLLLTLIAHYHSRWTADGAIETLILQRAQGLGDLMVQTIVTEVAHGHRGDAESAVARLHNVPNLELAVAVDRLGQVKFASHTNFLSQNIRELGSERARLIRESLTNGTELREFSADRRLLLATFVFQADAPGESLAVFFTESELGTQKDAAHATGQRRSQLMALVSLALCVLVWGLFERTVATRMERLVEATRELAKGNLTVRTIQDGPFEIGRLGESINRMAEQLRTATDDLRAQEAEARKLALIAARTDNAVVLTDAAGRIEWVNEGFTRLTGYTAVEARGQKPGALLQGPDSAPETIRHMHAQLARGEGFRTEIVNYARNGRRYWAAIEVQPIRDAAGTITHFMGLETDITARRQDEQYLRVQFAVSQEVATVRPLAEAAAVILARLCGQLEFSAGALWLEDKPGGEWRALSAWPQPAAGSPPEAFAPLETLLQRAQATGELQWRYNGEGRGSRLVVPIPGGDIIHACLVLASPATTPPDDTRQHLLEALARQIGQFIERLNAETALRLRSEELLRANAELERALRLKDSFLASMSHELRTPLAGILGLTELLLESAPGGLSDKQRNYLTNIETSGRHLLALINDLLDLAKIEAGHTELAVADCLADDLCQSAIQLVHENARKRRQTVNCDVQPAGMILRGDRRRLIQILVNLLGNAVKFTPDNGELGLRVQGGDGVVRFTVWDRGIGIDPTDRQHLFKPFSQLDNRLARKFEGTGLGLSLVKQLAALHQGWVEVQSEPGRGSEFIVTLPWDGRCQQPGAPRATGPVATTTAAPPAARPGALLLLAEDTPIIQLAIRGSLERRGYRVEVARDGHEAIAAANRLHPALILMDIQMPGMDGLEATRRIRASTDPEVAQVPIIALTALSMQGDRELCLDAGANAYVSKPVVLQQLATLVEQLLQQPARPIAAT
jgi:PAS domain S-box-containing protein